MTNPREKVIGTGTVIHIDQNNCCQILTAAHNGYQFVRECKNCNKRTIHKSCCGMRCKRVKPYDLMKATSIKFSLRCIVRKQTNPNTGVEKLFGDPVAVYDVRDCFIQKPFKKYSGGMGGYDLCIMTFKCTNKEEAAMYRKICNNISLICDPTFGQKFNSTLHIFGYPGDKGYDPDFGGTFQNQMYGMSTGMNGNKFYLQEHSESKRKYIVNEEIDCYPGTSGSSIWSYCKNDNGSFLIYGVHTGGKQKKQSGENYGTFLDQDSLKWIKKTQLDLLLKPCFNRLPSERDQYVLTDLKQMTQELQDLNEKIKDLSQQELKTNIENLGSRIKNVNDELIAAQDSLLSAEQEASECKAKIETIQTKIDADKKEILEKQYEALKAYNHDNKIINDAVKMIGIHSSDISTCLAFAHELIDAGMNMQAEINRLHAIFGIFLNTGHDKLFGLCDVFILGDFFGHIHTAIQQTHDLLVYNNELSESQMKAIERSDQNITKLELNQGLNAEDEKSDDEKSDYEKVQSRALIAASVASLCVADTMLEEFSTSQRTLRALSIAYRVEDCCKQIIINQGKIRQSVLLARNVLTNKNADMDPITKRLWNSVESGLIRIFTSATMMVKVAKKYFGFFRMFQNSFKSTLSTSFEHLKKDFDNFNAFTNEFSKAIVALDAAVMECIGNAITQSIGVDCDEIQALLKQTKPEYLKVRELNYNLELDNDLNIALYHELTKRARCATKIDTFTQRMKYDRLYREQCNDALSKALQNIKY
eukprot:472027_1